MKSLTKCTILRHREWRRRRKEKKERRKKKKGKKGVEKFPVKGIIYC